MHGLLDWVVVWLGNGIFILASGLYAATIIEARHSEWGDRIAVAIESHVHVTRKQRKY